jgi:hypothetical protein
MRLLSFFGFLLTIAAAKAQSLDLFDEFNPGWRSHWEEQSLFAGATTYEPAALDGQSALRAVSQHSASSLFRRIDLPAPAAAQLRWSWRIQAPVPLTASERTKSGDDYAVRVTVIFEHSALPMRSCALQYVWATREPIGSTFPSPYSANVGMFVLRTGNAQAGMWCQESRDLLADYTRFFGRPAKRLSAVAIMTDSDNSGTKAEGWYAGLTLELRQAPMATNP